MSQNDFTIANQGFPAFRADLNSALQALASNSSGATAPSTTFANMWWYDSANNIMYIRNEDNDAWIKFAELDQTNDKFVLSGTLQLDDGSAAAPALTFNSDTNMGIYRGGTDILTFVTAGTDRLTIDASGKIGIGTDAPVDKVHIKNGSGSGRTTFAANTDVIIEDDGNVGLQLASPNTYVNAIYFSDTDSNTAGVIQYDHSTDILSFDVGDNERMTLNSSATLELFSNQPKIILNDADNTINQTGLIANIRTEDSAGTTTWLIGRESGSTALKILNKASSSTIFETNGTERARIDGSGNLLVGKTITSTTTAGIALINDGRLFATGDGGSGHQAARFTRLTNNGDIVNFYKDSTEVGVIGSVSTSSAPRIFIANSNTGVHFNGATNQVIPCDGSGAKRDNAIDLGNLTGRYDDVYATNGTINTSDRNEKQDIEELNEAEQRVAVACKGLLRKYRWKDKVAEKGDNARTHFGIIAQDLQDAFTAEGLDASDYAMFISDTWWESDGETYDTEEEAPEGATQRTRLGVRYNQLLAFMISAI